MCVPVTRRAEQLPGLIWQSAASVVEVCCCLLSRVIARGDRQTIAALISYYTVDTRCRTEMWCVAVIWWAGLGTIPQMAVTVAMFLLLFLFVLLSKSMSARNRLASLVLMSWRWNIYLIAYHLSVIDSRSVWGGRWFSEMQWQKKKKTFEI